MRRREYRVTVKSQEHCLCSFCSMLQSVADVEYFIKEFLKFSTGPAAQRRG